MSWSRGSPPSRPGESHLIVFSEIIAAAADYEQSNRTQLMPRQQRQADDAAAQNWDVCTQVPCRGRPGVNREYSAIGVTPLVTASRVLGF
jgi:hypothetical protein